MTRIYARLLQLYPSDVRFAYGDEMIAEFSSRWTSAGGGRRLLLATTSVLALVADAAAERFNSLYSHRSFHGRRRPDLGVVRPPNMGKREWFGS